MVDKRQASYTLRRLKRIKTWQLCILLVLVGFIAATFLRLNNIGMLERRQAVLDADQQGDKLVIQNRLYDLQRYVSSHMNANLDGGIYLEHQYGRDRQAAIDAAANSGNSSGNIYKQITDACRAQYSAWSPYFQCVTDRLNASAPATDPMQSVVLPKLELYKYDFASPLWSPDFAGFSVLLFGLILLVIIARLIGIGILRLLVRRHYHRI